VSLTRAVKARRKAIRHIVHDYGNFVSSAEMVINGAHLGRALDPPINTHIGHAFYLNCRKMADFFAGPAKRVPDDIVAGDYVSTITFKLPVSDKWRVPINKQLAHLTYSRDQNPKEITRVAQRELYKELKDAWKVFGKHLPKIYRTRFDREIALRAKSEFTIYDLGF